MYTGKSARRHHSYHPWTYAKNLLPEMGVLQPNLEIWANVLYKFFHMQSIFGSYVSSSLKKKKNTALKDPWSLGVRSLWFVHEKVQPPTRKQNPSSQCAHLATTFPCSLSITRHPNVTMPVPPRWLTLEDLCSGFHLLDQLGWHIRLHGGSRAVPSSSPVTSERSAPKRLWGRELSP